MAATKRALSLADASVGSVMTRQVKTVEASSPLIDCIKIMNTSNIGSVVVIASLENARPVGIFTERDLVRKIAQGPESLGLEMAQVMSKPLITISATATVWDALTLMGRYNIRRLPVVDKRKLEGILTERDVFHLILAQQSILLESFSELMPASAKETLKGPTGVFGVERPPSRVGSC